MDQRFQKFRESMQAAVKLSIAAEEFFKPDLPEQQKKAYGDYLQQRILPATELLIRLEDTEKLETLSLLGWFPRKQMDDFLGLAIRERKFSAFLWLLQKKRDSGGFPPRDFSL